MKNWFKKWFKVKEPEQVYAPEDELWAKELATAALSKPNAKLYQVEKDIQVKNGYVRYYMFKFNRRNYYLTFVVEGPHIHESHNFMLHLINQPIQSIIAALKVGKNGKVIALKNWETRFFRDAVFEILDKEARWERARKKQEEERVREDIKKHLKNDKELDEVIEDLEEKYRRDKKRVKELMKVGCYIFSKHSILQNSNTLLHILSIKRKGKYSFVV